MKTALLAFTSVAVAAFWLVEKSAGAALSAQLHTARQEHRDFTALLREQQRLQRLDREPQAARSAAESAAHDESNRAASRSASTPETMRLGEWAAASTWRNRGCATAANAIETMMWAAAEGDVANLARLLDLEHATTTKLDERLATLPGAIRTLYPTTKDLIAAFTTKAIPLGEAQLVWLHQPGPDNAVACIWSKGTIAEHVDRSDKNTRPYSPSESDLLTKSVFLTLRRTSEGWHIVVPPPVIDSLAQELQSEAQRSG